MSYCVDALDDYSQNLCEDSYGGGASHAIIFPNYVPTDPTDGTEINQMIDDGEAVLITNVKIGMPLASPVTVTPYVSCRSDVTVNYDRTITIMDQNVVDENIEFYNSALSPNRQSVKGIMYFECDANRTTLIDADITLTGSRVVPDDNTDLQHFEITGAWRSRTDSRIYTTPANVFPA